MPRHSTYRHGSHHWPSRRWIAAVAVLVSLAAGVAVAIVPDHASGEDTARDAARFVEPVGALGLIAHTDPEASARSDLAPVRPDAKRVPDSKIRLDVGMKLEDSSLPADAVDYGVRDQVVRLTGRVDSPTIRDRIELLARSVRGVRGVDNDIQLPSLRN
jgi:osmotically-inducible protein OsmY